MTLDHFASVTRFPQVNPPLPVGRHQLRTLALLATTAFALILSQATGAQINWGNRPFTDNQTSQDIPLSDHFVFELGIFEDGFVPTVANTAEWADHWRVADRVTYNPENSFFSGSYTQELNLAPLEQGRRGYIWGYRHDDDPRQEWILVSDPDWLWPEANPLTFPISWLIAESNSQIVGQVDADDNFTTARIEGAMRPRLTGEQWQARFFTPSELQDARISGWSSDPDADGANNLMEMAFATVPLAVDSALNDHINVRRVRVGGATYLEMQVARRADRQVDYAVEVSFDQKIWEEASIGGTVERDSLHELIVRDGVALEDVKARFIRLTVRLR